MSGSTKHPGGDVDWAHIEETHHVVYLVKRKAYGFVFAVPKTPPTFLGPVRAFFRVCFNDARQPHGFVLSPEELEDFYAGLTRLQEYLGDERTRHAKQAMGASSGNDTSKRGRH